MTAKLTFENCRQGKAQNDATPARNSQKSARLCMKLMHSCYIIAAELTFENCRQSKAQNDATRARNSQKSARCYIYCMKLLQS